MGAYWNKWFIILVIWGINF